MIAPANVFLPLSVVWIASEIMLARARRSKTGSKDRDRKSLVILWTTIVVSITIGVYLAMFRAGQIQPESTAIADCGLGLILFGLAIRWFAILSLGRLFTVDVAIVQGHHVVRTGIYKWIRHPSYSGALISFLGLGMAFSNYFSIVVIFVPICAAFLYRIQVEEKALRAAFGDEYREYSATTKRLIPWLY